MNYADLTVLHVKAARALLSWSQGDLANAANLAASTVKRLESAEAALERADTATKRAIFDAFSVERIQFLGDGEPGVRLLKNLDAKR